MAEEEEPSKFQAVLNQVGSARPLTEKEKKEFADDWKLAAKKDKEIFG